MLLCGVRLGYGRFCAPGGLDFEGIDEHVMDRGVQRVLTGLVFAVLCRLHSLLRIVVLSD